MNWPTPAIMQQAIDIHGCNCDSCCLYTPLSEKHIRRIKARLAKRAARLKANAWREKLAQAQSILYEAGYTVIPPTSC